MTRLAPVVSFIVSSDQVSFQHPSLDLADPCDGLSLNSLSASSLFIWAKPNNYIQLLQKDAFVDSTKNCLLSLGQNRCNCCFIFLNLLMKSVLGVGVSTCSCWYLNLKSCGFVKQTCSKCLSASMTNTTQFRSNLYKIYQPFLCT